MDVNGLVAGGFALGGVLIGGWLNSRAEKNRWRRDYLLGRMDALRAHFADVVEALDGQVLTLGRVLMSMKNEGDPVPAERRTAASDQWVRVFSRKSIEATSGVQKAIVAFDAGRHEFITAINAGDVTRADAAQAELQAARADVLTEINEVLQAMNEALAPILGGRVSYWWRRVRGGPTFREF